VRHTSIDRPSAEELVTEDGITITIADPFPRTFPSLTRWLEDI
jgi:hypothetical protein